ncbi:hypothetical protein FRB95_004970 [Tulasnella sp. JGI-2019a]|nr:hypothetical protein FRB95_004970 [Tulasnella sp. JGI-2019a]
MSWERIETKVKPIARSGHRMTIWKHFIVLFGGFVDLGVRTNYLNDVWLFSLEDYKWVQVEFPPHHQQPSSRSGFSFLPTPDGVVLHGGYYKDYIKGKRPVGVALDDTWFLRMSLERKEIKWEKRKKIGYAPNPPRSGCTMALWPAKGQGIMFGGVSDVDKDEEVLESVFFNDMYAYQTAGTGRWTSLNMRAKKKKAGASKKPKLSAAPEASRAQTNDDGTTEGMDIDNAEDEEWAGIEHKEKPPAAAVPAVATTGDLVSSTQELDINKSDETSGPFLRYNAMLAVLKNTLYIYGGIYESGSKEYTLDDFWALQLDKMDSFTCLRPLDTTIVTGEGADSSDDDDDGDDEDDEDEGEGDDDDEGDEEKDEGGDVDEVENVDVQMTEVTPVLSKEELLALRTKAQDFLGSTKDVNRSAEDQISTPLPGESLAIFYARSKDYWAQKAHQTSDNKGKLLRRDGFGLAEDRYATYKPILDEVEKILAEAGLDDEELKRVGTTGNALGPTVNRNRR